jgi:sterol desaturase/sphingolipid hydroxylase (fatty acid hydroxylase superfamily)
MINTVFKRHSWIVFAVVILGLAASAWLLTPGHPLDWIGVKIAHKLDLIFFQPLTKLFKDTILTPAFFLVTGVTLLIEQMLPARRSEKFLSPSRLQDFVWFFYETVLHAAIVVTFTSVIYVVYAHYFTFLTIKSVIGFPEWQRFLIAVVVQDFVFYAQHWVHHKVPWLWNLHAVHHSQKELNFFTDFRYHILEYVLRELFLVVPFLILGITPPAVVYYVVFRRWYTHFYHANIKSNLGPLRYILVTPQSHRVHHSLEAHHLDKNFGSIFVVWDFLFGTQYKGWNEYPATGIVDPEFPHEKETDVISLLVMPVRQMVYSLEVTWRQVVSWLKAANVKEAQNEKK